MSKPRMPRIPSAMIDRLANIARRLEALTDPADDGCSIPADVKRGCAPYVQSWIEPDVLGLLAWARGEKTAHEIDRWFPSTPARPKKTP